MKKSASDKTKSRPFRRFAVTWYDLEAAKAYRPDPAVVKYFRGQIEKCPETGRKHFQGYIEVAKSCRFTKIKKILNANDVHVEPAGGSAAENRAYTSKEESRLEPEDPDAFDTEFGKALAQGARTDLLAFKDRIVGGATNLEVADEFPDLYVKYHDKIEKIRYDHSKPRTTAPTVHVLWGETGAGKSHLARELAGPGAYWVPHGSTKWWPGYRTGQNVIFDDFREEWCRIDILLHLLNWTPAQAEVCFLSFAPFFAKCSMLLK